MRVNLIGDGMDNLCNVKWELNVNKKRLDIMRAAIKSSGLDKRHVIISGRAGRDGWGDYTIKIYGESIVGRTMNGTDYWNKINELKAVLLSITI
jgi:hypothetical protein